MRDGRPIDQEKMTTMLTNFRAHRQGAHGQPRRHLPARDDALQRQRLVQLRRQSGTITGATLSLAAQAGHSHLIKKASDVTPATVKVIGTAATAVKKLGSRTIGL
jgi:hypothetical protein